MGQIYHACIYDTNEMTAYVMDADKFHANCYSFSGTVAVTHYLLRQKPHNVMWGGGYVVLDDALADITDEKILLGISTYENYEAFERNNESLSSKSYYDRVKFIDENNKTWIRISVWEEALKYFDIVNAQTVPYTGYLINHSKKLAVDLADYQAKAVFLSELSSGTEACIDPIPVLTETSGSPYTGGAQMAYLNGVSAESTPEIASSWQGDLLQIVDSLPAGYHVITCCFADVWARADYCYRKFGTTDEGLVKDGNGLYEATFMNIAGKRSEPCHIKVELTEDKIRFTGVEKQGNH